MTVDSNDIRRLPEHFERFLGPISRGWSTDADGNKMAFQIVQFSGGSDPGSVAFSTLGLSRHALQSPVSGRSIRHELLMLAPGSFPADRVVSLLEQVGTMTLGSHRPLLRGDVIGPAGALVPGSDLTALYVTGPVYFPDDFAIARSRDGDVVVAWLVPISTAEAQYVGRHGWQQFEEELVAHDPDLVDFERAGLNL